MRTEVIPFSPRFCINCLRSTFSVPHIHIFPFFSICSFFSLLYLSVVTTITWESDSTCALTGILRVLSRMMRRGSSPFSARNPGLSCKTVLIPTKMASYSPRNSRAYIRALSLVIHFESPVLQQIFPSRLVAHFTVTKGNSVLMYFMNFSFNFRAFSSSTPIITSTPWSCNSSMP